MLLKVIAESPVNCLVYQFLLYLSLMTHPLHQEKQQLGMELSSEKLAALIFPSSNAVSGHKDGLGFQCMPLQILNIEIVHQQQLAFSLQSGIIDMIRKRMKKVNSFLLRRRLTILSPHHFA